MDLSLRGLTHYDRASRAERILEGWKPDPGIQDDLVELLKRGRFMYSASQAGDLATLRTRVEKHEADKNVETFYLAVPAFKFAADFAASLGIVLLAAIATAGVGGLAAAAIGETATLGGRRRGRRDGGDRGVHLHAGEPRPAVERARLVPRGLRVELRPVRRAQGRRARVRRGREGRRAAEGRRQRRGGRRRVPAHARLRDPAVPAQLGALADRRRARQDAGRGARHVPRHRGRHARRRTSRRPASRASCSASTPSTGRSSSRSRSRAASWSGTTSR